MALNQFGGQSQNSGDIGNALSGWANGWGLFGNMLSPQGNSFSPSAAPINSGVTQGQIDTGYNQTQTGLQQQQAFLAALAAQNGTQNQSNVFGQQQALASQLQQNALGQGPNPAQAMLANQTGQNVSQQASLMGSQRGASQNVGLMQRQAAQQGAGLQQNSVGQAAALQAQQQLAAQQQLGQQQAQMQNVAGNQVGQLGNATNAYNSAAQNQYGTMLGAQGSYNNALQSGYNTNNQIGAGVAAGNQKSNNGLVGGLLGGIGSVMGGLFAQGGEVPSSTGPMSLLGKHVCNMQTGGHVPGNAAVHGNSLKNDTVPAMLSPGEVVIPRSVMESKNPKKAASDFVAAVLAKHGKTR